MDPCFDSLDQGQLPCASLYLPHAEREEAAEAQKRQRGEQPTLGGSSQEPMPGSLIGIMLLLRWYMIHSEPAITISTITAVKA